MFYMITVWSVKYLRFNFDIIVYIRTITKMFILQETYMKIRDRGGVTSYSMYIISEWSC